MERRRSNACAGLVKALTSGSKRCDRPACEACNALGARHTKRLQAAQLVMPLEFDTMTVITLVNKILRIPELETIKGYPCYLHEATTEYLRALATDALKKCKGLCLDCVKAGGRNDGKCRIREGCSGINAK